MSFNTAVADVAARIGEIQSQFGAPATVAPKAKPVVPFSQVLAAATMEKPEMARSLAAIAGRSDRASDATGDGIVSAAKQYLGVPYVWGGTDPSNGLDCSGLVQRACKDLGIDVPRVAADQARIGTPVASLDAAVPGDLVAFGSPVDHIGIYAGDGKMVVAPKRGDVVKIQDISRTPVAIRRIVPESDDRVQLNSIFGAAGLAGLGSLARPSATASTKGIVGIVNPSLGTTAYDELFAAAGAKYNVDPKLLSAVAKAESGYNPAAVSGAGAQGLMQIMPATARGLGVNPLDPSQAVDGAARLLAGHISKFGSVGLALAAYNAGGGAVTKHGGIPPYPETQNYVRKVLSYAGVNS